MLREDMQPLFLIVTKTMILDCFYYFKITHLECFCSFSPTSLEISVETIFEKALKPKVTVFHLQVHLNHYGF